MSTQEVADDLGRAQRRLRHLWFAEAAEAKD
jgi:hypothetical protein